MNGILFVDEHDRATKRQKKQIAKLVLKVRASNDLPMIGTLTRVSRKRNEHGMHLYVISLRFKQSRRWYADEHFPAKDIKHARAFVKGMYPSAKIK